ncbi:GNAT family N-acetyltransferase [Actinoplanes friuliensis]|uniref:GCN5-like N-acetyltransferase n=1 Tax=Actinoplanes friuliensis DSM 7358 TaxID=1246995 RepID=U5W2T1_9ACTN|nr:GCN5-like N-acetyltransferase [Actinoplanes friuliensis DSM 7358]
MNLLVDLLGGPELPDHRRMVADFLFKPVLTGDKVVLRPFEPGDFAGIKEALLDPEVMRLTGSQPVVWDQAAEARMREWYDTRAEQADRLDLAVEDRATGDWVGEVVLNKWDPANAACNFRIMFGPSGQDRGLGTEATRLMIGYAFQRLGLHRISLEVYNFNPRARRVYEKAGFVAEGVLRDALRTGDGWVDATVMAILADDWRALPEERKALIYDQQG